jgi:predicted PurR-regulated permease PerM
MRVELDFNKELLIRLFFFAAFAVIVHQIFLLSRPFMPGLLGAAVFAIALNPLHVRVRHWIPTRTLSALVMTLLALLLAILPLIWLSSTLIQESDRLVPSAQAFIEEWRLGNMTIQGYMPPAAMAAYHKIAELFGVLHMDLRNMILENVQDLGVLLTSWSARLARNAFLALFNFIVMAIAMFFIFRDGERVWRWLVGLIPMQPRHKEALAERAYETFRAVMIGVFVTAAAQGLTAMFGYWVAGVRLPVLLGMATSMSALLGASFLVTLPVALSVIAQNRFWGIALLIWGVGVVGIMDNFLKPLLIGSRARMPLVLIFFSIIGGLKLYGFLGIILGPVLLAAFFTFVKIYREEYIH